MAVAQVDIEQLKQHIGRRLTATDIATAAPANLLRHTFGRSEPEFKTGDPVPPGWHLLYFLPRFGPSELRPDGSPLDSGVVPSMPLPRRMIAREDDGRSGAVLRLDHPTRLYHVTGHCSERREKRLSTAEMPDAVRRRRVGQPGAALPHESMHQPGDLA